jgi:hypothetical protein
MREPRVLSGSYDELETPESKRAYFARLTVEERHAVLQEFANFVAEVNPDVLRCRREDDPSRSVRILRVPRR